MGSMIGKRSMISWYSSILSDWGFVKMGSGGQLA